MKNKIINYNKIQSILSIEAFLALLFAFLLFALTLEPPIWGYDEFGALITHLELDDKRVLEVYMHYASSIIGAENISKSLLSLILTLIVVPLRWTYSIGISPLYGFIRIVDIDWHNLRVIFLSIQIIINAISFYFLLKNIRNLTCGRQVQLLIFILFALSPTYLYWTNTLSSYAFHLPAFMLLLSYFYGRHSGEYKVLNKHSISAGLAQLLNYQYIFVFLAIGFYDFITNSSASWKSRIRIIIFPTIIALLSLSFLYARSLMLGIHKTPNMSLLTEVDVTKYSMFGNNNTFTEKINFAIARFFDVVFYFFDYENYYKLLSNRYSQDASIFVLIIILSITVVIYLITKKAEPIDERARPIIKLCVGILIVQFLMYLTSIYPFMPSRHALIIFIPIVINIALLITWITDYYFAIVIKEKYIYLVTIIVFISVLQCERVSSSPLDIDKLIVELDKRGVDRLILAPCDLEPALNIPKLSRYGMLYRCGSYKFDRLNSSDYVIAVYSSKSMTNDDASAVVRDYMNGHEGRIAFVEKFQLGGSSDSFVGYKSKHLITIFRLIN
jgi:hypothetical protein